MKSGIKLVLMVLGAIALVIFGVPILTIIAGGFLAVLAAIAATIVAAVEFIGPFLIILAVPIGIAVILGVLIGKHR